jgi:hypothetical protein
MPYHCRLNQNGLWWDGSDIALCIVVFFSRPDAIEYVTRKGYPRFFFFFSFFLVPSVSEELHTVGSNMWFIYTVYDFSYTTYTIGWEAENRRLSAWPRVHNSKGRTHSMISAYQAMIERSLREKILPLVPPSTVNSRVKSLPESTELRLMEHTTEQSISSTCLAVNHTRTSTSVHR